jgi:hypothetical protein
MAVSIRIECLLCFKRFLRALGSRASYWLVVAHMEWALEERPRVDDLVDYETRVNYMWPRYRDAVICVYDLAKFGGHIVMDIIRTHPMVLIGGSIQENPFFQPPDEFLGELRERRAIRVN